MKPISIIIFALVVSIFILQLIKYRKSNPMVKEIPKPIEKAMKKNEDTPEALIKMAEKIVENKIQQDVSQGKKIEKFSNPTEELVETFRDIKDIRYGRIGGINVGSLNGSTIGKWVKIASVKLNGAWNSRAMTLEIYPRTRWDGSSRQSLVVLIRNNDQDVEEPYVSLTTHNINTKIPNPSKLIGDVRIVRVSGTSIKDNILEVWIQFGTNWAESMYCMWYLHNVQPDEFIALTEQPIADKIPAGQNWGIQDSYDPNLWKNVVDANQRRVLLQGQGNEQYSLLGLTNNKNQGVYLFVNSDTRQADGGPNTATLRNDWGDLQLRARANKGLRIKSDNGFVGINTDEPKSPLEVAGKIRLGRWTIGAEGDALVFRDELAGSDKRYAFFPNQFVDVTESVNTLEYPLYTPNSPVVELGQFGMGPWGGASNFIDKNAKWIWAEKNAQISAGVNIRYNFQTIYNNTTGKYIQATIHTIIDNEGIIFVNESNLRTVGGGWGDPNYPKISTVLKPGRNLLRFNCANLGGAPNPAGLIVSIVDKSNNNVLINSNASWVYSSGN